MPAPKSFIDKLKAKFDPNKLNPIKYADGEDSTVSGKSHNLPTHSSKGIHYRQDEDSRKLLNEFFPGKDPETIARAMGAIEGSTVTYKKPRSIDNSIYAIVSHPNLHIERLVRKNHKTNEIEVDHLLEEASGPLRGTGYIRFGEMLDHARNIGIRRIFTVSSGRPGHRDTGYHTWPAYGFDGKLPEKTLRKIQRERKDLYQTIRTGKISELFSTTEGARYWRDEIGHPLTDLVFEVDPNSPHSKRFQQYYENRQKRDAEKAANVSSQQDTTSVPKVSGPNDGRSIRTSGSSTNREDHSQGESSSSTSSDKTRMERLKRLKFTLGRRNLPEKRIVVHRQLGFKARLDRISQRINRLKFSVRKRRVDFVDALRRVRSLNQKTLYAIAQKASKELGLTENKTLDALYDTTNQTIPGILHVLYGESDREKIDSLASWIGLSGDLPGMGVFHIDPEGPDSLHRFRQYGSGIDIRDRLNYYGVYNRILIPQKDSFDVIVPDPDSKLESQLQKYLTENNIPSESSKGYFYTITSDDVYKSRGQYRDIITQSETS